jgi:enediyne polyketide synthase
MPQEDLQAFLKTAQECYKSIFPVPNEDFVAGSISATIAGRICNYFDFHGGAFVTDGACASSLMTVLSAANLLASNDLDLALAGGIDISLDPFELVGFSRNGALSKTRIRPYDRRGDGFIAGEGGGLVLLKRLADAQRDGDCVYAIIRGWGMASDGKAGIMQPVAAQQAAAIRRATARAGCSPTTFDFVEGHGTGTRAGDRTEIEGLSLAMLMDGTPPISPFERTCGIGSLKSLIGHTKATAGVASLIKAVAAVNRRVIPPTASCEELNDAFNNVGTMIFPIRLGEVRPSDEILRAGVSAFGFGGINTHLVIESGGPPSSRLAPRIDERSLLASHQESEVFVFGGRTRADLREQIEAVALEAAQLSHSDLVDLASSLTTLLPATTSIRAAIVADSAADLESKLTQLHIALEGEAAEGRQRWVAPYKGVYVGSGRGIGRLGFLFPGQGSQQLMMGRPLTDRFAWASQLSEQARDQVSGEELLQIMYPPVDRARDPAQIEEWARSLASTELAQPAICLASVLLARYLQSLDIRPAVVGGHSLGEITALHIAGAFDAGTLFSIVALRGRSLRAGNDQPGAMASLACSQDETQSLLQGISGTAVIANINSPMQTVVSGDAAAIETVLASAARRNIHCRRLPVSNGFHSPLVACGAHSFEAALGELSTPATLEMPVVSGMPSTTIDRRTDLRRHLTQQITSPVNFIGLVRQMRGSCDALIEVGPGRILSGLCREITGDENICTPVAAEALRWDPSPVVAVSFVNGINVNWNALYEHRLVRPYVRPSRRIFLSNPAEQPIALTTATDAPDKPVAWTRQATQPGTAPQTDSVSTGKPTPQKVIDLLVELIATRTGYPESSMSGASRLLDDLNLDSIKAGELVAEASRRLGIAGALDSSRFANSSIKDIALALSDSLTPEPSPARISISHDLDPQPQSTPQPAAPVGEQLSFVTRYPSWTRNYVIETRPAARDRGATDETEAARTGAVSLVGESFLILFESRDREPADALAASITLRGGHAELRPFNPVRREDPLGQGAFTRKIAILPRQADDGTPARRLSGIISRLISSVQAEVDGTDSPKTAVYVQFGGGTFGYQTHDIDPESCCALAFARSLHLERKGLRVRVVDFAKTITPSDIASRVLDEIQGEEAFASVGFDEDLVRRIPVAYLSEPSTYLPRQIQWTKEDVILVTGGAKGIMAECALGIARDTGATLVLVGRGHTVATGGDRGDSQIDQTLQRFNAEGLPHLYFSCDITDSLALTQLITRIEAQTGVITAIVHGASILRPCRIDNLSADGLRQEVSPKVLGAWNLCDAMRGRQLKLFVAISSLVVDHGMPWSAGYAFANETMERVTQAAATQAALPLQIISFGLWGSVGRPATLKTNEHLLSVGLHDGEIPPEEGVARFMRAFLSNPGSRRLGIYGRSVGYTPWDLLRPAPVMTPGLRFVEKVVYLEPQVELIARCRLSLQRDRYLHDHIYNGMYIVPTVFALEALAQAATALMGSDIPITRLETIEMPFPIVVDETHGQDIELRAQINPATVDDGLFRVSVAVSTGQTWFKTKVLSGVVVFGPRRTVIQNPVVLEQPLPIVPREDLYDRQFFVGPSFQRMAAIYSVEPSEAMCTAEVHADRDTVRDAFGAIAESPDDVLIIGDPFVRDTLLHTSLLHHLEHMAFTSRIQTIELFDGCETQEASQRICTAHLSWSNGNDAEYDLVALCADGRTLERWTGFSSKALAGSRDWPRLEFLLDAAKAAVVDERHLADQVVKAASRFGVTAPAVCLQCVNGFSDLPADERHAHENETCDRAMRAMDRPEQELKWLRTGKPYLQPLTDLEPLTDLDISFSHEGCYCLCSIGAQPQGCDLAAIRRRGSEHGVSLLGAAREPLLAELSGKESTDTARTRVWAALEASRKATGSADEILTISARSDSSVLFRAQTLDKDVSVLTLPVRLTHGPEHIVALTVAQPIVAGKAADNPPPKGHIVRDVELGCDVLEYEITVSWKECTSPGRTATTACFVEWFHRAREAMLSPQKALSWATAVIEGTVGLVARSIQVELLREVTAHDDLCERIWMTHRSQDGVSWRADFWRKSPDGSREPVATLTADGRLLETRGSEPSSSTDISRSSDYDRYVPTRGGQSEVTDHTDGCCGNLETGLLIFEAQPGPGGGPLLFSQSMRPSLRASDLVGNVSSITFFDWSGEARDHFLHSIIPQRMTRRAGIGPRDPGEALCIKDEMVYLREAFPFEDIALEMKLMSATERSANIRFEFGRRKHNTLEKIAVGHQQLLWIERDGREPRSAVFPVELLRLLSPPVPAMEAAYVAATAQEHV